MTRQLPSRVKLHLRYPSHYTNNLCPRCLSQPETFDHIFSCPSNNPNLPLINKKIKNFLTDLIRESKTQITNQSLLSNPHFSVKVPLLLEWALGISTFDPNLTIIHKAKLASKSTKIIYKYIWKPRSATANTSPQSAIKWKKTKASPSPNQTKKPELQIFESVLKSFLINNSTTPNPKLINQIITNISSLCTIPV
jgi:hypothetical protein